MGLIGAIGNLANLEFTYESVRAVTAMPFLEAGQGPRWRTGNPVVVWLGVAVIIGGKLAAAIFCGWGAFRMVHAARFEGAGFVEAKRWAVLGCGLAVASLFGGFIALIMLFVAQEE